jgi:hypothetical protein
MNILEACGLAYIGLVVVNLISMLWAMKKAVLIQPVILKSEPEV